MTRLVRVWTAITEPVAWLVWRGYVRAAAKEQRRAVVERGE